MNLRQIISVKNIIAVICGASIALSVTVAAAFESDKPIEDEYDDSCTAAETEETAASDDIAPDEPGLTEYIAAPESVAEEISAMPAADITEEVLEEASPETAEAAPETTEDIEAADIVAAEGAETVLSDAAETAETEEIYEADADEVYTSYIEEVPNTAAYEEAYNAASEEASEPASENVEEDTIQQSYTDPERQELLEAVNAVRAEYGLPPLSEMAELSDIAQQRAVEISGYFSHYRSDGTKWDYLLAAAGLKRSVRAENIAYGCRTAQEALNSWLNDYAHRENILNPEAVYIGIGCCNNGCDTYWVQIFLGEQ